MRERSLLDLVAAFTDGRITRDEYWAELQLHHRALQDYCSRVRDSSLERIEVCEDGLYVVLRNGLRMSWQPQELRSVASVLVNHGEYETNELKLIECFGQQAEVALDIGANTGYFTLHLARLMSSRNGSVYALEPVESTYAELQTNVRLNGLEGTVRAFKLALGEKAEEVTFFVPEFHGSVAASARPLFPDRVNREVKIRMVPLDDFVAREKIDRIDLVKCDVEGAELAVLRGGIESLRRLRPVLMLEMLRKWARCYEYHPDDIIELLGDLGYRCWSYEDAGLVEYERISDACSQTNFFFLHTHEHKEIREEVMRRLTAKQ